MQRQRHHFSLCFFSTTVLMMMIFSAPLFFLQLIHSELSLPRNLETETEEEGKCEWRHNITTTNTDLSEEQEVELQLCLWEHLLGEERRQSPFHQAHPLLSPPAGYPLRIAVEHLVVEQVDTLARASVEFNVYGHMLLGWNDSRVEWDVKEWPLDGMTLKEEQSQELWTPTFSDETNCGSNLGCLAKVSDLSLTASGQVVGRLIFRFPSYCRINYRSYPEEQNDCCLYLSVADIGRTVKFNVDAGSKTTHLSKQVPVSRVEKGLTAIVVTNLETSPWAVQNQGIEPVRIEGVHGEHLRICVQAKKEMSTLRIALRIPVTIATLLMLVSPLFGDLRTQAFVKLLTLLLQTICFLFLCSIAPANGFGGSKPKLYTFYEFMFTLTFLSILVTTVCLALSRMKRTVPASHGFYLAAKMLNHFLCCIEPDPATNYQRHLDDSFETASTRQNNGPALQNDYSLEWRHIYIAANNFFSGICFTLFCFVIIFDIM